MIRRSRDRTSKPPHLYVVRVRARTLRSPKPAPSALSSLSFASAQHQSSQSLHRKRKGKYQRGKHAHRTDKYPGAPRLGHFGVADRSPGYRPGEAGDRGSEKGNGGRVSRLMLAIEIRQYLPELRIDCP